MIQIMIRNGKNWKIFCLRKCDALMIHTDCGINLMTAFQFQRPEIQSQKKKI